MMSPMDTVVGPPEVVANATRKAVVLNVELVVVCEALPVPCGAHPPVIMVASVLYGIAFRGVVPAVGDDCGRMA
jgi:hypothetical protein